MTQTSTSPGAVSEEDSRFIEELVCRAMVERSQVASVTRKASEFVTLFPAEVLTVTLGGGREVRLFLKHLGDEPEEPDKRRRDREVRVYAELFRGDAEGLPVARYFGSRRNTRTNRLELYLEYVDDWSLRYHDLEHWFAAARRLADLHAHFARRAEMMRACDFLLQLDAPYFQAWGERAAVAVAWQSPELGLRLQSLLANYAPAYELLANQPPTLVHNDLACKNVIADRSATPARTCIIDWELAGVGCGLLDVVHLKYGLDPASDAAMVSAYRAQLASTDLLPRDDPDFARLLAACELHKTLYRLAHSPAWKLPVEQLAQWIGETESFLKRVRGA